MHVGRPCRALAYFLMKNYNSSEIVNIGTGKNLSIKELAEKIKKSSATTENRVGQKQAGRHA